MPISYPGFWCDYRVRIGTQHSPALVDAKGDSVAPVVHSLDASIDAPTGGAVMIRWKTKRNRLPCPILCWRGRTFLSDRTSLIRGRSPRRSWSPPPGCSIANR